MRKIHGTKCTYPYIYIYLHECIMFFYYMVQHFSSPGPGTEILLRSSSFVVDCFSFAVGLLRSALPLGALCLDDRITNGGKRFEST